MLFLLVLVNLSLVVLPQNKSTSEKRIGIVNVSEVLNKYLKKAELEKGWKTDQEKINEKLKQKNQEMETLREEFMKAEDDVEREKLSLELLKLKKEREFYMELNTERMEREIGKAQLEMIRDIKKTIQDYGEENKFFLILQTQPTNSKPNNLQEALLKINLADVMYYDKDYDITDKIIEKINAIHSSRKK